MLTSRKLVALCQCAIVWFILVDSQTDHVCGNVEDAEATLGTLNGDKLESVCKAAASRVGESRGQQQESYDFSCFAPAKKTPGYFVFLANEHCLCLHCEGCPASLSDVFTCCFYVGYLQRRLQ